MGFGHGVGFTHIFHARPAKDSAMNQEAAPHTPPMLSFLRGGNA